MGDYDEYYNDEYDKPVKVKKFKPKVATTKVVTKNSNNHVLIITKSDINSSELKKQIEENRMKELIDEWGTKDVNITNLNYVKPKIETDVDDNMFEI